MDPDATEGQEARGAPATRHSRDLAGRERHRAAQDRARAEAERQALLQSIVEYMDRERAMTNRLAEQSALLELAPDPIFVRDGDRRITYWNKAAEQLYGYTREQALGQRPRELLHTEYPKALDEIEAEVEANGFWEGDLVQTARDGRLVTVASRWGAVYDDDGHLSGLLEVNRDITTRLRQAAAAERTRARRERERMSERLVRAQRLESLGHLAGGIAHDFNNLLAVMAGYASMGAKHVSKLRAGAGEQQLDALDNDLTQISEAAQRAALLTRQLLSFARQESVRAEVIDVNAAVGDMFELLRRTLGSHIELRTRLDPSISPVRVDSGQLGQILVNLAVNSRAAMPTGGRLSIETDCATYERDHPLTHGVLKAGRYVRLRVNDNGVGMTRDVVEHAFDPFFTTKPMGEGTGLGLATVYGIVTQAGGQVELYSEPGIGTTLTLLLPAADEPVAPKRPTADPLPVRADEPRTILVVEDEPALREVIAANITEAGYTAVTAGSSSEALDLAKQAGTQLDLVLTDVVMPQMLGQQLAERLAALRPELKVVFMSGFAQPFLHDPGKSLPGPLLQKPFTENELLNTIAERLRGAP